MVAAGWRFLPFAAVRLANAAFALATVAYCVLSYSPFAYDQFIRPQLVRWLPGAVAAHHQLFWILLGVTLASLAPHLRRRQPLAWGYAAAGILAGSWLAANPALALAGQDTRTLLIGLAAVVPVLWLAAIDISTAPPVRWRPTSRRRLARAAASCAAAAWFTYGALVPWRIRQAAGVELTAGILAPAWALSLAAHAALFAILLAVLLPALAVARRVDRDGAEYWTLVGLFIAGGALVLHRVVAAAISFGGWQAFAVCLSVSASLGLAWAGIALHRSAASAGAPQSAVDVWVAPVPGTRDRAVGVVALPALAYLLASRVAMFDWNFLFQKLGVFVVWFVAFAFAWSASSEGASPGYAIRRRAVSAGAALTALAMLLVLPMSRVADGWDGRPRPGLDVVMDRYAAMDASFHLIRDLLRTNTGDAARHYAYLRANSTLGRIHVDPVAIDFAAPLVPARRRPHVFLLIVDSLRPDYLSPYNRAVTFTPGIGALAAESFVFERAFTRYGATGLSVPSIWAGGMLVHKQYVKPFAPMNALEKLLDASGYHRFFSRDHIVTQLFQPSPQLEYLDEGRREMDFTLCTTLGELEGRLRRRSGGAPVFAMTRPLELHMANLAGRAAPAGERYPGFAAAYAGQVARLDACLAAFVRALKRLRLYDDSVIILTADHGESLGEDGRWGHAYTLFPEVIRIPLIVRLPGWLRSAVNADVGRLAFSTDITPTLYHLNGMRPSDLGALYGASLFDRRGEAASLSRDDAAFLLSSSYGPVYGLLTNGGTQLFISDAIEGRDHAYDLTDLAAAKRVTIVEAERARAHDAIRGQIAALAAEYRFGPAR